MDAHVVHVRRVGRGHDANGRIDEKQIRGQRGRNLRGSGHTAGFIGRGTVRARGVRKRGAGQVEEAEHAFQVGVGQVGTLQRTAHEVRQHRVLQVGSAKVSAREVGVHKNGFTEVHARQIGIGEVAAGEVNAADVAPRKVLGSQVDVGPVAVHQERVRKEQCLQIRLLRATRGEIEHNLLPNEGDGLGFVIAGLKQHVVELVFITAAVGTG